MRVWQFFGCMLGTLRLSLGMAKTVVDIRDAEAHFAELIPLIREGKVITLCEANQPLAEIRPLRQPMTTRRPFGLARGQFAVLADFGKPDPGIERLFYGEPG
jgi:antitoxin (DNA-binding transcriptional repressor) of toxin-antitoxin stability system